MTHLLTVLRRAADYDPKNGPANIVKNVGKADFIVDERGRMLGVGITAAVDPNCSICNKGIESGHLRLLESVDGPKQKRERAPKVVVDTQEQVDSGPVVEQTVIVESTVAPAEPETSIQ